MKDMKINLVPLAVNAIGIPTKGEVFADLGGNGVMIVQVSDVVSNNEMWSIVYLKA